MSLEHLLLSRNPSPIVADELKSACEQVLAGGEEAGGAEEEDASLFADLRRSTTPPTYVQSNGNGVTLNDEGFNGSTGPLLRSG